MSRQEWQRASGVGGRLRGYLPHRWPKWLQPEFIHFDNQPVSPFRQSMPLTRKGDVAIIPTPGHTPHHVSVIVSGSPSYLLAGDTSYTERLLLEGKVDGVSPNPGIARQTLQQIAALAQERPLVYLPSHDPESLLRLEHQSVLTREAVLTT